MISTVILDYGKVLAYPVSGNWFIPYNFLKTVGIAAMVKLYWKKKKVNGAFEKGNSYLLGNHTVFTEEEEYNRFVRFYRIVFDSLNIRVKEKTVQELAREIVYSDYVVKFYDDVLEGTGALKGKYKVMVLADTWPSAKRVLNSNGVLPLLDGLIMSCNYGETKDTKLFGIAAKEYSLVPGECVFIDDSVENLKHAAAAGFRPVLMDRDNSVEKADYPVIKNMGGIEGAIAAL